MHEINTTMTIAIPPQKDAMGIPQTRLRLAASHIDFFSSGISEVGAS
jgi:hypothetical protein